MRDPARAQGTDGATHAPGPGPLQGIRSTAVAAGGRTGPGPGVVDGSIGGAAGQKARCLPAGGTKAAGYLLIMITLLRINVWEFLD